MIKPLTSFRFFAAIFVVMQHMFIYGGLGSIAVSFFFILSGFILTYNYHDFFKVLNKQTYISFFKSRFARIYPMHIVTFLLSLPIYFFKGHYSVVDTFVNLFLLQTYIPNYKAMFSFNEISWTISTEFFFYITFPFVIYGISKLRNRLTYLVVLAVILYLTCCFLAYLVADNVEAFTTGWWLVYVFPPFRFVDFFSGIVLCFLFLRIKEKMRVGTGVFTALESLSIVLFVVIFKYPLTLSGSFYYSLYFLPFLCLIVFVFAFQSGYLSKLLSIRLFVHLGDISYSTYMIHQLVIRYTVIFFTNAIYTGTNSLQLMMTKAMLIFIILCLSDITFRYIEIPTRKWINAKKFGSLSVQG